MRGCPTPLAAFDADGQAQPYLAQSFTPSSDYRTWTVTMRPGITFQDGEKADAAAVVTFINALKASTLTGAAARPIQSAEASVTSRSS
jgi:peptide/nickel transport system substrate-binding protein